MILVCLMISPDHTIKVLCDFMGGSPLQKINNLPGLVIVDIAVVGVCFWWLAVISNMLLVKLFIFKVHDMKVDGMSNK